MENQNMNKQIANYIVNLKSEVYHPLLKRDLGEVEVKETATFFLLLPLLNGEKWSDWINTAAIAVGAVHAAFDAHDDIDIYDASATEQQLTVLSGDYFSGVHYRLLASLPDFYFITALSKVIGNINEMKTNFHYQSPVTATELIEAVQTIEVGCINEFFHAFGFSKYMPLVSAAYPLLILEMLKQNKEQRPNHIIFEWDLRDSAINDAIAKLSIDTLQAIEQASFLSPFLKEEIFNMTTPLLRETM